MSNQPSWWAVIESETIVAPHEPVLAEIDHPITYHLRNIAKSLGTIAGLLVYAGREKIGRAVLPYEVVNDAVNEAISPNENPPDSTLCDICGDALNGQPFCWSQGWKKAGEDLFYHMVCFEAKYQDDIEWEAEED